MSNNVTHIADRNEDSDEINLRELFATLLAGKWLILFMITIAAAIGYAHLWRTAPVYKADVLLQVEKKGGVAIPGMELLGLESSDLGTATEIQIIQSRKILGQVVDELKLAIIVQPNYFPFIGESYVRNNFSSSQHLPAIISWLPIDFTPYTWGNEALDITHFTVSPEYENQALTLLVGEHSNYQVFNSMGTLLLKGIVSKTVSNQEDNINLHISKINAKKGKSFTLTHKSKLSAIQDLRNQLKIAEVGKQSGILRLTMQGKNKQDITKKLNKISSIYLQLNVSRSAKEASKSLEFLQGQVKALKAETDKADNDLQQFRTKNQTIDLTLETGQIMKRVAKIEEALQVLLLKQAELERKYTHKHPRLLALATQKANLQQQKNRALSQSSKLPKKQQVLLRLEQQLKIKSEIYIDVLNKIQGFKMAEAGTVGNVYILDSAVTHDTQISPKPAMILAIAAMLGALLGIAITFIKQALKTTIEDAESLEIATNLPVYITVPRAKKMKKTKVRQQELLRITEPHDPAIESLRSLRTSLRFAMIESDNNIVMISGTSPAAGKSFISSNLSAVIADSGQRVLLIDADIRKGYLADIFKRTLSPGLSEYIANNVPLNDVIQTTEIEGLDLITCGQSVPNPSELLMHNNFERLLQQVSAQYDLVLLDTPPIHAVTDPVIIGKHAGVIFLVIKYQFNTLTEVQDALKVLSNSGIPAKGFILNNVEPRAQKYAYGEYSYDSYYAAGKR